MNDPSTEARWHVTADGAVLQEWRDDRGRVRYGRSRTHRPVDLEELTTLDERVVEAGRTADRNSNLCMGLAGLGLVGGLLGWIALPAIGVGDAVALAVVGASVLLLLVGAAGIVRAPRTLMARMNEAYAAAGLESLDLDKVDDAEARGILEAPGTRSAPRRLTH